MRRAFDGACTVLFKPRTRRAYPYDRCRFDFEKLRQVHGLLNRRVVN